MACDTPHFVQIKGRLDAVPVPCGRCPPCKARRVNSWVFRLLEEEKRCTSAFFITLSYDTEFVPLTPHGFMTLRKSDVQTFFKRLRKLQPDDHLRYYLVGEYGSKRFRPHYHIILFGLSNVRDMGLFIDSKGKTRTLWKSAALDAAWVYANKTKPGYRPMLGDIDIGDVSGASITYTLKYISKPGRIPLHGRDDRLKEFSTMSKGLGKDYLTPEAIAYHQSDLSNNFVMHSGFKIALPKYYRTRIFDEEQRLKQRAIIKAAVDKNRAEKQLEFDRQNSPLTFDEYLESERLGRYNAYYDNQQPRDFE